MQNVIEQRIFEIEPELTVAACCAYESMWKIILCALTPLFAYIPVSHSICSSGYLEVYSDSLKES